MRWLAKECLLRSTRLHSESIKGGKVDRFLKRYRLTRIVTRYDAFAITVLEKITYVITYILFTKQTQCV